MTGRSVNFDAGQKRDFLSLSIVRIAPLKITVFQPQFAEQGIYSFSHFWGFTMHIAKKCSAIAAAAVLAMGAEQASAAIIDYHVSGTITEVSAGITDIGLGDLFSFDLSIEATTPDTNIDPTSGDYLFSITEFSFSVGGFSGGAGIPNSLTFVKNGFLGVDGLNFVLFPTFGDMPNGFPFTSIEVLLEDADLGLLASDNLLGALTADSSSFQDLRRVEFGLGIIGDGGPAETLAGTIDQAGVPTVTVAEPASLVLFGAGLAGLGFMGRRRKQCRSAG